MKLSIFNTPRQSKPSPIPPEGVRDSQSLPIRSTPLPEPAPIETTTRALQQRILNRLFLVAVLLGIVAFAANLPLMIQGAQWLALGLYSLMLLGLIVAALLRRMAYIWRTAALLLALFVMGLSTLVAEGLYGSGLVFLVVLPFFTAVLTGRRGRLASLALSIGAVGIVGALMVSGLILAPEVRPGTGNDSLLSWIVATANLALLAIGGVLSFGTLIDGLGESLERQHALTNNLENERSRLEMRVQERSDDLHRRLVQIRTAAEINRAISRVLDIQQLLPQVCELVRQRFDLYYVGIFLIEQSASDPENKAQPYAVLRAGSGEAGRRMLAEGHKLAVGSDSMIGWATANRQPRIAQNVGQEVVRFNNPHLPLTRSELALPIQIHESSTYDQGLAASSRDRDSAPGREKQSAHVLGAMSIQSILEAAFDQDDILILQSIADGLASAIENARLFAATQANLEEIRTLHRQYLEQAWQLETALRGEIAYSFQDPALPQTELAPEKRLEMPIRLRDQVIGHLTLEPGLADEAAGEDRSAWSGEELALIEAVTNQAALALENARLLEETRRKVNLEHTATTITSKLWASADIETILRTALQELSASLGAREGSIELWPGEDGNQPEDNIEGDNLAANRPHSEEGLAETQPEKMVDVHIAEERNARD